MRTPIATKLDQPTETGEEDRPLGESTQAVHAGEARQKSGHAITDPIFCSSTYTFHDSDALLRYVQGTVEREEYGRYGNPTEKVVERKLAALEGGEDAILFSSGMAAVAGLLLAELRGGDEVVFFDECYHRSREFCTKYLARFGVVTHQVKACDYEAMERVINPHTKILVSESPTNPHLSVVDLERFATIGRKHEVLTLIDATLATPYNVRPLEYGVDYVLHSATKYLGGHNDLLAGVVIGSRERLKAARELRGITGPISGAHNIYLLARGLKTFALRMRQQNGNGLTVARALESHPRVQRVFYPGLESHAYHEVARQTMRGFGGLITFLVKDADWRQTAAVVDAVKIPRIGPSLGGVESLIEQPLLMSYHEKTPEERAAWRIPDNMIRLSCGIENAEDLIADLSPGAGNKLAMKFRTRAIHVGNQRDPQTGAVVPPIHVASTYVQPGAGKWGEFDYSRSGNPTRRSFETTLASLEGGCGALAFSSGMAATHCVTMLLSAGDQILAGTDIYGGTYRLLHKVINRTDIAVSLVNTSDLTAVESAIRPQTRLLWIETPGNPLMSISDIAACARVAEKHNLLLAVDSTFATPVLTRPLELGAHIVMHSATKYIGGHSDLLGGALVVRDEELGNRLYFIQNATGAVMGPFESFLASRGLKTIDLRMREQCDTAFRLAEYLHGHPQVRRVLYPGLTQHPGHEIARRQMAGYYGAMLSFEIDGDLTAARRVVESTHLFQLAVSLGAVESLIEQPATMSHASYDRDHRLQHGITDGLIRLSVGLEAFEDLRDDLAQALGG